MVTEFNYAVGDEEEEEEGQEQKKEENDEMRITLTCQSILPSIIF